MNLPETWTKAENLLDLDLDVFVRFRDRAWHGRVKSQETSVKSKASVKCNVTQILLTEHDREMVPQGKQAHTTTASYASCWGKTKKIRFESEKIM